MPWVLTDLLEDIRRDRNQMVENQVLDVYHLSLKIKLLTLNDFFRQGHTLYPKLVCSSLCTLSWIHSQASRLNLLSTNYSNRGATAISTLEMCLCIFSEYVDFTESSLKLVTGLTCCKF